MRRPTPSGNAFLNKGDTGRAIADYNQAIQLDAVAARQRGEAPPNGRLEQVHH
jgi:predicted negative regulator of RcsB-dependent stress response